MTNQPSAVDQVHPVLLELGFSGETEIQRQAIPALSAGDSVLALAPTGSGKTLAFLVPLMAQLDPEQLQTQLLVLAPTRELAVQIASVATQVAAVLGKNCSRSLQVRTVYGGQKSLTQKIEIEKRPAVVVATPGRALELLEQNVLQISNLSALVLDEADLMVGMGFEAQIKAICDHLPNKIQAALFSATESEGQNRLQNRLVHRGKRIDVRTTSNTHAGPEKVDGPQFIHETLTISKSRDRLEELRDLLQHISPETETGIVFCETRESVQRVTQFLAEEGVSVVGLSGELGQIERTTIMRRFKSGGVKYLVSTNIAARGIDVSELSVVVHFDLPSTQAEYLHRSGRTGRAGKSGRTISLCTPQSQKFLTEMLQGLDIKISKIELSSHLQEEKAVVQDFVKLHFNRGKSSKLRPGDFLGALTKDMGLRRDDVGGIFIFDHFTHIEISRQQADGVLRRISDRRIKNLVVKATNANELSSPRQRGY